MQTKGTKYYLINWEYSCIWIEKQLPKALKIQGFFISVEDGQGILLTPCKMTVSLSK